RNEMVALENEGYLRQPHTSAGRVPTDKGYRFFVDSIVEPAQLGAGHVQQVRSFFSRTHGELESLLHDTTRLLSDLTDYAAVITVPHNDSAVIRSVQLVGLTARTALVVLVLSDGTVDKHTIELADDTGDERLAAATAHLGAQLVGTTVTSVPTSLTPTGDAATDAACGAALGVLALNPADDPGEVFVGGAARVAGAFDAVDTVRQVLSILEQQYVVVTVLRDVIDRGLQVAIGSETGLVPLSECSLVVAPYEVEGELAGTIGVLGPTRMNYPQALAAVAVVSRRLGRHLTEG
ncbi:MAG: heat-inducible transcriptional repressor HrcA, partial [Actinomycetota bacterium]|nr:heat-inducible transcriptional repressor HrcA [Actinomycetota bacterium]